MNDKSKKRIALFSIIVILLIVVIFSIRSCTTKQEKTIVHEQTSNEDVSEDRSNTINNDITEIENKEDKKETVLKEYTITFLNKNGSVLLKTTVKEGATPYYSGGVPKYSDGKYIYTFIGWDKIIKAAYKDETYIAQYSIKNLDNTDVTKKDEGSQSNPPSVDKRPKAVVDVAPVGKAGLVYDGSEKELLSSLGQSSTGTLMYGVSTSIKAPSSYSINNPKVTNAGTYYVYFYSKGDSSHQDSPASYITVKVSKISGSVSTNPTAINPIKFNNTSQTLINAGATSTGTMQYGIGTETSEPSSYSANLPTGKNIGTYYVWYYSKGDVNHNDTTPSKVIATIGKGDGVISKVPVLSDALEYTGSALPLIKAGQSSTGTMKYLATTSNSKPADTTGFDTTIPSKTEKDTYYVWYFADESDNYNATDIKGPLVAELTGTKCKVTKAPTAKSLTFNNDNQDLINPGESTGADAGKMVYAVTTTTDMPADGAYSDTNYQGKNAGTYYVWYKAVPNQGDSSHSQSVPKSIEVKIAKAPGTAVAPTAKDLTYSGEDQVLITQSGSPTGTMKYMISSSKPKDKTNFKEISDIKGKDAGTYKVWYYTEESDNYLASDISSTAVEVTISKADGSITAPTANSLTYTGENLVLVSDGTSLTGTPYYALGDDSKATGSYSTTKPSGKDAGTYYVWYYSKGDSNHNDTDPSCVKVEIGKADGLVKTAPVARELEFNNEDQQLVTAGVSETGTMYYYMNLSTEGPQGTGKFETSIPNGVNVGKYYVWYFSKGDSNHKDTEIAGPVEVEITKIKCKVTKAPAAKSLTFNNDNQDLINPGESTGADAGDMVYAVTTTNDAPSSDKYSTSTPTGKNAGTYYVWYKAVPTTGDTNHADSVVGSIEVKIAKAPGTAVAPTAKDLTYSGEDQELITQSGSPTGTMKYMISSSKPKDKTSFKEISDIKGKDAGTYKVWYYTEESDNYLASDISSTAVEVTINKASGSVTAPTANSLTYSGENLVLVSDGTSLTGTLYYALGDDSKATGSYSTTKPSGKDAGTYYVWYYSKGDSNHNDTDPSCVKVEIGKADGLVKTAPVARELEFNNEDQQLVTAGVSETGIMYYYMNLSTEGPQGTGKFETSIPNGVNVGKYYVWYFSKGDSNHKDTDITGPVEVEITKIKCKVTTPPAVKKNLVYNTKDQELLETLGTSEGDDLGDMVYAVTTTNDAPSSDKYADKNPTAKDAGTYYVWYKAVPQKGDTDHADSVVGSIEVKIAKAPGTAVAPTAKDLTYSGEEQELITQSGSPTGTMKYMVSSSKPKDKTNFKVISDIKGKDAGTYKVWYYTEESDNYLASDISSTAVEVTINKAKCEVTEIPSPVTITYKNGMEETELLSDGGKSEGVHAGTLYYALGTINGPTQDYSTSIPKANTIDEYYIWYKAVHSDTDLNNIDSDENYVLSKIVRITKGDMMKLTDENDGYKNYLVLDVDGDYVKLLRKESGDDRKTNDFYMAHNEPASNTSTIYANCVIDKFLNETYYNNLSTELQNAIIDSEIDVIIYDTESTNLDRNVSHPLFEYCDVAADPISTQETLNRKIYNLTFEEIKEYYKDKEGLISKSDVEFLISDNTHNSWILGISNETNTNGTKHLVFNNSDRNNWFKRAICGGQIRNIWYIVLPVFTIDITSEGLNYEITKAE